ncbi:small integral membrane protein 19 [Petromyzon marinus]|uniref:Small integral membrane protein 19 n=1 Tax=Petromyzon marinus TaxID=7757 RepID=A0AAJ7SYA0_PETMA|nr:small integral membrane protein 19 [Petromyzon marinus]
MEAAGLDYSVHEAWTEATNVYLVAALASVGLLVYARRNRRKIQRIFGMPPSADRGQEDAFLSDLQTVRLRQQLEMYYMSRKHEQRQQQLGIKPDSVQLQLE